MEVTRKNFKETLPIIEKSIIDADFLVIDTEFTGLINGRDVSMFDSPEEYYLRLLSGCSDFLLIQYGLCAFRWDPQTKHYMNEAYNFYLFPRGRPGPERMFLCQSSSLDFLASQGFDFNKLIREGISYMTEPAETRLKEYLTERQKLYSNEKEIINIPEENKPQIDDICKKVRKFLDENQSDQMEIDRCNAFIRRLLFQELGVRFKNEAFVETKVLENKNSYSYGVVRIMATISSHNPHLCCDQTAGPRGLVLVSKNGSEPNRGYNQTIDKQHEAGYDAYVTGLCFLSMHTHLTKLRNETCARVDSTAAILKPFINKIFLAKTAHQDSPYINLAGKDPSPSRDHVFHLTFPKEWQRNDINQLFSPFGPITVQFLDETTALVALSRREQARDVARALANSGRTTLVPYSKFKPANKVQPPQNDKSWRKPDEDQSTPKSSNQSKMPQLKPSQAHLTERLARTSTHVPEKTSLHEKDRTSISVADDLGTAVDVGEKLERRSGDASATKNGRQRTLSASSSNMTIPSRKRTSSGVFQVDEAEPIIKKNSTTTELTTPQAVGNGVRKSSEALGEPKEKVIADLVIETFVAGSGKNTVNAFKENDSWE